MPSIEPGRVGTTAATALVEIRLLGVPKDRPESLASWLEAIGAVLRPPTSGRLDLVTVKRARSTTLRLMSETPAPVSTANTNGPAPFIQPVAVSP